MKFGSITTGIITDGLVFNMDAANRASTIPSTSTTTVLDTIGGLTNNINNEYDMWQGPTTASFYFDGVGDYIDVSNSGNTITFTDDFTINCFIKLRQERSSDQVVLGKELTPQIAIQSTETIRFYSTGTSPLDMNSNSTINLNTWYYISCVLQKNTHKKIYINGVIDKTTTITNDVDSNSANIDIGRRDWNGNLDRYFYGSIANIQIYNRALSASEVLHNYNALKGRFA